MVWPEVGFDVLMMAIGFQEERRTFSEVLPWKTCFQLAAALESNDRAGRRWRSSGCPATVDRLKQVPQARCVGRWQLVVHRQLLHGDSKDKTWKCTNCSAFFAATSYLILSIASVPFST